MGLSVSGFITLIGFFGMVQCLRYAFIFVRSLNVKEEMQMQGQGFPFQFVAIFLTFGALLLTGLQFSLGQFQAATTEGPTADLYGGSWDAFYDQADYACASSARSRHLETLLLKHLPTAPELNYS